MQNNFLIKIKKLKACTHNLQYIHLKEFVKKKCTKHNNQITFDLSESDK